MSDRFKVVEGGGKPKAYRPRAKSSPQLLVCSCGSAETVETKTGRMVIDGKVQGGTKQVRCYHCQKVLI